MRKFYKEYHADEKLQPLVGEIGLEFPGVKNRGFNKNIAVIFAFD